mgnify:CR=1 FL=1
MSNILENLKKRLQVWHEERAARMEAARQAVNVMEFNGALYLSVSGVPLLGIGDISGDLPSAVQAARENYKDWKEEKLWERRGTTHAFTLF